MDFPPWMMLVDASSSLAVWPSPSRAWCRPLNGPPQGCGKGIGRTPGTEAATELCWRKWTSSQPLGFRDGSLVRFTWFSDLHLAVVSSAVEMSFFPCLAPICDHASWGCSGSHGKFMVLRYEPSHITCVNHTSFPPAVPSSIMSGNP